MSIPLRSSTIFSSVRASAAFGAFGASAADADRAIQASKTGIIVTSDFIIGVSSDMLHCRDRLEPRGVNGRDNRDHGRAARDDAQPEENLAGGYGDLERARHQEKLGSL